MFYLVSSLCNHSFVCLFVLGFGTLSVTSPDQQISIYRSLQWSQAPLVGYVQGPRRGKHMKSLEHLICFVILPLCLWLTQRRSFPITMTPRLMYVKVIRRCSEPVNIYRTRPWRNAPLCFASVEREFMGGATLHFYSSLPIARLSSHDNDTELSNQILLRLLNQGLGP